MNQPSQSVVLVFQRPKHDAHNVTVRGRDDLSSAAKYKSGIRLNTFPGPQVPRFFDEDGTGLGRVGQRRFNSKGWCAKREIGSVSSSVIDRCLTRIALT